MSTMEPTSESVYIIYDPNDGTIAHVHMTTTIKGGTESTHDEIERNARHAAEKNGVEVKSKAGLHVSRAQWESRTANRVNVDTNSIV